MEIVMLQRGEKPPPEYCRRPHPCWIEFAERMSWFTQMQFEPNGTEGMVYVWVLKSENYDYERGHNRTRYCVTYRGKKRRNLDLIWAKA